MYGAIIGDIAGSAFEFNPTKSKGFVLFSEQSRPTDDSVMTVAVADALLGLEGGESDEEIKTAVARSMKKWGRRYPDAGYGGRFREWLASDSIEPYGSYGNGSAMRVSPAAWLFDDIKYAIKVAGLTAAVTHDHPEGLKGAKAVCCAIHLARFEAPKRRIRQGVENYFGYDLHKTCREIRKNYSFDVSCQGSVPEAIVAFLDGTDYEDVIREAIALGGDADTQAAIAGSIAEAHFGIPDELIEEAKQYIPADMQEVIDRFYERVNG